MEIYRQVHFLLLQRPTSFMRRIQVWASFNLSGAKTFLITVLNEFIGVTPVTPIKLYKCSVYDSVTLTVYCVVYSLCQVKSLSLTTFLLELWTHVQLKGNKNLKQICHIVCKIQQAGYIFREYIFKFYLDWRIIVRKLYICMT